MVSEELNSVETVFSLFGEHNHIFVSEELNSVETLIITENDRKDIWRFRRT